MQKRSSVIRKIPLEEADHNRTKPCTHIEQYQASFIGDDHKATCAGELPLLFFVAHFSYGDNQWPSWRWQSVMSI